MGGGGGVERKNDDKGRRTERGKERSNGEKENCRRVDGRRSK